MRIFQRIKDMSRANMNEMLDKIEDPVSMLNQYMRDMQEDIAKAEVTAAKQIANERMLKERVAEALSRSTLLEQQAANALTLGQEEAARKLLEEKLSYDERAKDLAAFHTQSKVQADELLLKLHELKDEFYRMRSKKNELGRPVQLAHGKKRTAEVLDMNRIDAGSAARGFSRIEEKIMQLEAEADVKWVIGTSLNAGLSSSFAAAPPMNPIKKQRIEDELLLMKEKYASQA